MGTRAKPRARHDIPFICPELIAAKLEVVQRLGIDADEAAEDSIQGDQVRPQGYEAGCGLEPVPAPWDFYLASRIVDDGVPQSFTDSVDPEVGVVDLGDVNDAGAEPFVVWAMPPRPEGVGDQAEEVLQGQAGVGPPDSLHPAVAYEGAAPQLVEPRR